MRTSLLANLFASLAVMALFMGLLVPGVTAQPAAGAVSAWGANDRGQLGDGTNTNRPAPVPVSGLTGAIAIAAGGDTSLALMQDLSVKAWGRGLEGQLGNNQRSDSSAPIQVLGPGGSGTLGNVSAVAEGDVFSLALLQDGTVFAWGGNPSGGLGNGTFTFSPTPVQVLGIGGSGTLSGVTAIAAGGAHSMALLGDGTVVAWGFGARGQLGNNQPGNDSTSPVKVLGPDGKSPLTGVVAIAASEDHSMALKSDGTVFGWGANDAGQVGDGTTTNRPFAVQVSGLTGVKAIGAGTTHSLAAKQDGTVFAWGSNAHGELGNGTTTGSTTPVQTTGAAGVAAISGGTSFSLALKGDGTVLAWGANDLGQLGNNQAGTDSPSPVQVSGLSGATIVSAGGRHSLALTSGGPAPAPPTSTPAPPTPPAPPPPTGAVDAKVEIVFPHDAAGNPIPVERLTEAPLVNVGSFLFNAGSLNPVPCGFNNPVRLFRAANTDPTQFVAVGTPRQIQQGGNTITIWDFNDVDVSAATNPLNKYYFTLSVDGTPTNTNVWSHGADARTIFPQQDVPTGVGPVGNNVDAKVEIVFPHLPDGTPVPVENLTQAPLANIEVAVFAAGTLQSAAPDANLTVHLFQSLNNDPQKEVGVGQMVVENTGGVMSPRWVFNDVDVSQAQNPLNKYYFRVVVDGVTTNSNVWAHGQDARTIFPQVDTPSQSCQP